VLTPAQMVTRLETAQPAGAEGSTSGSGPIRGRFELLAGRRRGAPPRHQSLRAALDWSYDLLSPELQRFFACLSVFRGGWTPAAAEAVCDEPAALECLEQLQEASLVTVEESEPVCRFQMLETLREYAAEQLADRGESEQARARHLRVFLELVEA